MQIDHANYILRVLPAEAELLILTLVATNAGCGDLVDILGDCTDGLLVTDLTEDEYTTVCELQRYLPELF